MKNMIMKVLIDEFNINDLDSIEFGDEVQVPFMYKIEVNGNDNIKAFIVTDDYTVRSVNFKHPSYYYIDTDSLTANLSIGNSEGVLIVGKRYSYYDQWKVTIRKLTSFISKYKSNYKLISNELDKYLASKVQQKSYSITNVTIIG